MSMRHNDEAGMRASLCMIMAKTAGGLQEARLDPFLGHCGMLHRGQRTHKGFLQSLLGKTVARRIVQQ